MPDDISKMKVADLKRELKLRGLAITGNKNELQDRLQTALIDGDELLEDAAISGEEELLTDEEEAKILGGDENELLKSPTTTPTVPELRASLQSKTDQTGTEDDVLGSPNTLRTPRKIVLKRTSSFSSSIATATPVVGKAEAVTKENAESTESKIAKRSERNPITMNTGDIKIDSVANSADTGANSDGTLTKVSSLSLQERLDLRAKKFGIAKNATSSAATKADDTIEKTSGVAVTDEKQLETMKKRAERFGCVVSSKMVEKDTEEKLLKRKQRFGGDGNSASPVNSTGTTDVWAEKARQRLLRFKTTPAASKATPATTN